MIFQGLAPGIFAAISDSVGRRPTYIVCFVIYVASNIGLALTKTYWLLMLLRAIQATGNSATVALGAGVIADIATPNERGGYLGIFGVGPLTGPSLGPIIGGALAQTLGWRAIFWFLAIFGGVFSVFLVLFLPETLRSIVGNGSVRPTSIWQKRVVEMCMPKKKQLDDDVETRSVVSQRATLAEKKRTNILESFRIILQKDVALILFIPGIHYAIYIMCTPLLQIRLTCSNHVHSTPFRRTLQPLSPPRRSNLPRHRRRHSNRLHRLGQTPRQRLENSGKTAHRKRQQKTQKPARSHAFPPRTRADENGLVSACGELDWNCSVWLDSAV